MLLTERILIKLTLISRDILQKYRTWQLNRLIAKNFDNQDLQISKKDNRKFKGI